jgi:hypothetical protein
MKNQIVLWAAQMTADPRRRRIVIFGLAVLALVSGVVGVAEAGPVGGGSLP